MSFFLQEGLQEVPPYIVSHGPCSLPAVTYVCPSLPLEGEPLKNGAPGFSMLLSALVCYSAYTGNAHQMMRSGLAFQWEITLLYLDSLGTCSSIRTPDLCLEACPASPFLIRQSPDLDSSASLAREKLRTLGLANAWVQESINIDWLFAE